MVAMGFSSAKPTMSVSKTSPCATSWRALEMPETRSGGTVEMGSGKIGLAGYRGSYLTATSTYFGTEGTAAQYGIFSSDAEGPGSWSQLYASNFNDSGMYVGACHQVCDVTISHAWMEYDALGYSGTNSGGAVVIEDSEFDENEDSVTPTRSSTVTHRLLRTETVPAMRSVPLPIPDPAGYSFITMSITTTTPTSPWPETPPPDPREPE